MPTSALYQSQLIPELRNGSLQQVSLGALRGLVCAPSFHTTSAVLFMLTAWPIRSLRWPLIAVNVAMLFSIPVEGTHYLADMIGGVLVALVAYSAQKFLSRRLLLRKLCDNT
jgi:membrane-associated phospholipid phosphatase